MLPIHIWLIFGSGKLVARILADSRTISINYYLRLKQKSPKKFARRTGSECILEELVTKAHLPTWHLEPFDLAILDSMMPLMDGETLGRKIKEDPRTREIQLMLLTTRGLRGDAARAQQIGFDAYLRKPIKQSHLLNALMTVFGMKVQAKNTCKEVKPIVTRHSIAENCKQLFRILLVEDNPVNQKVAQIHLRKFGHTADIANNGLEAIDALEKETYHLVLMDLQMPKMGGYEATQIIREQGNGYKNVPIIAMTANAMKGDRQKCLDAGMNDYLAKPINPKLLQEKIEHWVAAAGPAAD